MRKAYMILAHKNFQQVGRLMDALNDGQSRFFLHADSKVPTSEYGFLKAGRESLVLVDAVDASWGTIGAVLAAIHSLRAVRDSGEPFDRIILLSGQDYPIKSNDAINEYFEQSPSSIFLDSFSIPCPERWRGGGMFRVNKYYCGLSRMQLLRAKVMNFPGRLFKPLQRHMPRHLGHLVPHGGSQWWSVDTPAMNYILDFVDAHPAYVAYQRFTYVVDEVFFQTILRNAGPELQGTIRNDNLRFIKWKQKFSKHPEILTRADFDAIAASPALYARKFDQTMDGEILDRIDRELLARSPRRERMKDFA